MSGGVRALPLMCTSAIPKPAVADAASKLWMMEPWTRRPTPLTKTAAITTATTSAAPIAISGLLLQPRMPDDRPRLAPALFRPTRLHGDASFRRDEREFVRPAFPRAAARGCFFSLFTDRTKHPPQSNDKGRGRTFRGLPPARERGT